MARPFKWKTKEELEKIIKEYFENTEPNKITLTGLCIALETNKQTLANYQEKDEFRHLIEMAKLHVEHSYELSLRKNGRSGDIFALKNFGWKDKMEVQNDVTLINKRIKDLLDDDDLDNIENEIQ
jgi:hypothetical protein